MPIGLYGAWKFQGLTDLGLISLDTDCKPKGGVFKEPGAPDKEIVTVYVESPPEIVYKDREVIKEVEKEVKVLVEVPVEVEKEVANEIPVEIKSS